MTVPALALEPTPSPSPTATTAETPVPQPETPASAAPNAPDPDPEPTATSTTSSTPAPASTPTTPPTPGSSIGGGFPFRPARQASVIPLNDPVAAVTPRIGTPAAPDADRGWPTLRVRAATGNATAPRTVIDFRVCATNTGGTNCARASGSLSDSARTMSGSSNLIARSTRLSGGTPTALSVAAGVQCGDQRAELTVEANWRSGQGWSTSELLLINRCSVPEPTDEPTSTPTTTLTTDPDPSTPPASPSPTSSGQPDPSGNVSSPAAPPSPAPTSPDGQGSAGGVENPGQPGGTDDPSSDPQDPSPSGAPGGTPAPGGTESASPGATETPGAAPSASGGPTQAQTPGLPTPPGSGPGTFSDQLATSPLMPVLSGGIVIAGLLLALAPPLRRPMP